MADVSLIGDFSSPVFGFGQGLFQLSRFQATNSGTLKFLRQATNFAGTTHIKCVVYSDNSGSPDAVLSESTEHTFSDTYTYIDIDIPDISIVSGTYYWIGGINGDVSSVIQLRSGGVLKYLETSYSGFSFPNPPSGMSDWSGYSIAVSGMGEEASSGSVMPLLISEYRRRR